MKTALIFTSIFLISLITFGFGLAKEWLVLHFILHTIWLTVTSKQILERKKLKNKIDNLFKPSITLLNYIIVGSILIIVLSISFGFRLLFATFYKPFFLLALLYFAIYFIQCNYILIAYLNKKIDSQINVTWIILSFLFYPLGAFTFSEIKNS